MVLFRSFALGLLGACFVLLAMRPAGTVVVAQPSQVFVTHEAPPSEPRNDVTVVDVARGLPGALLAQTIVLAANERIVAIDDVAVEDGPRALAALELAGRSYVDVAVANDAGVTRRVLVLAR